MSRSRLISAFLVALLIISGLLVASNPTWAEDLIDEDNIMIDGDQEFAQMASSEGWPGNGTEGNPYIIQGYSIDAQEIGSCITISNTTVHFLIRDSLLLNAGPLRDDPGCGIIFQNVTNGTIDRIECQACEFAGIWINASVGIGVSNSSCSGSIMYGVLVTDSPDCTVFGSECDDTYMGIFLVDSDNCTLERNYCYDDEGVGIMIEYSDNVVVVENDLAGSGVNLGLFFSDHCLIGNNTIERGEVGINLKNSLYATLGGNVMTDCSLSLLGNSEDRMVESYITQEINDCTVNGLPVLFIKNTDFGNASVPSDVGQIIVANVTNISISDIDITDTSVAVIVAYSSSVYIHDSSFSDSSIGIDMDHVSDSMVYDCEFHDLNNGVDLFWSRDCVVTKNNFTRNNNVGIYLEGSSGIDINDNLCSRNKYGIYLTNNATDNHIADNLCSRNSEDGIYMWGSPNNLVENNTVEFNRMNGISCWPYSDGNVVVKNLLLDNEGYSFYALSADDLVISDNEMSGSEYGIFLYSSSRAEVMNNTIWNVREGIHLLRSSNDVIGGNDMSGCSMVIDGEIMEYFNTHSMPVNNTVNGLPLVYIANQDMEGQTFTSEVGELILANVTGLRVGPLYIQNGTAGIVMGFCNDTWIFDTGLFLNEFGIFMMGCEGCGVFHCDISGNAVGIAMEQSNQSSIVANLFVQNEGYAIDVDGSSGDLFWANAFRGNNGATEEYSSDHVQAHVLHSSGIWSISGYGNHWSDWTYPDQNGDGIVDLPYIIDNNTGIEDITPLSGMVGPPAYPRITGTGDSYVQLAWQPTNYSLWFPLDHYAIYRQEGSGGSKYIAKLSPGTFSFNDTTVNNLTEYSYYILAVNKFSTSAMDWPLQVFVPSERNCLVTGVVRDESFVPIEGARVATENGAVTETDDQGHFRLIVEKGTRTFGITKQGYDLDTMKLDIRGDQADIGTVILHESQAENEYLFIALLGVIATFVGIAVVMTWVRGRD
ncbi:MAG TPA: NosD domain-containing protein [Methanomassiliicoccales archaeon]|nr:NosD domain-containing protein [Methanomassiliicoccales archaeon]